MVVSAPHILQNWWQNICKIHNAEIRGHLGALFSLLGTQCDKVFVTQLMGFWEPSTITFKFLDFEITPTLEEFSSITELPVKGRLPMIPSAICTGDFLSLLDLHIFWSLRYVDSRQVELDYLFQRFGHSEVGIHDRFGNRRGKILRLAEYCESYGSSKRTRELGIVPGSINYLIQVVEEEEEDEEDPKEDPEEDLEKDPDEDPEEDPEEGWRKTTWRFPEMDSNIYDPRDEGVIDMFPERGPNESPEYHSGPYYDGDDDDGLSSLNFFHKLLKVPCGLSLLYALWPLVLSVLRFLIAYLNVTSKTTLINEVMFVPNLKCV
ncbi:hypothetical protein H5410_005477 [Solanum commersonii]|uniref:DUF7745 domain-containing protein n=1 Tax=Solanum commersonii TaxID=4109 RepID=A0A9J6A7J0_SOLCO|nr:hypothetical protein H5410_005477 [Solanum commersonii]